MTRNLFILLFVGFALTAAVFTFLDPKNTDPGVALFFASSILVIVRRVYLKMKPWWGGGFRDIVKYFKKP